VINPVNASETDWPAALRADGKVRDDALRALSALLHHRLRAALRHQANVAEADCEDFAQEALLRILTRLDQFQNRSRFETWASAIALNTALARLRRKHWQNISLDTLVAESATLPEAFLAPVPAEPDDPAKSALLAALARAIAENLTERQRAGLDAELRGMPVDQIATLLGAKRNAVYKLLHDARRAIKRRLTDDGFGATDLRNFFPT
jgi:RNA polymerase sigma-70 factor (ECF subfamily)